MVPTEAGTSLFVVATSGPSRARNTTVFTTLNAVWALANCWGVAWPSPASPPIQFARLASDPMKPIQAAAPTVFTRTWTSAARHASRDLPIAARTAVIAVPIFAPRMIAIPVSSSSSPLAPITMTMPVVALDDCTRPVNTAPISRPTRGELFSANRSRNGW